MLRFWPIIEHQIDYGSFADRSTASAEFLGLMLVGFLAAEESLIHFDDALEFSQFPTARLTQAVEHKPCRLLLHADLFGDLHGGDTLCGL